MRKITLNEMIKISIMTVVIIICAWITIPFAVPFTMQTFGIFLTLMLLGGRNGTISIVIYILLGMIGLPVFSGFNSGIGCMMGPTGGYIAGFVLCGLIYWMISAKIDKPAVRYIALAAGLIACYIVGTLWFIYIGTEGDNTVFIPAFVVCVLPYIPFDILKLFLSGYIVKRIKKFVVNQNYIGG